MRLMLIKFFTLDSLLFINVFLFTVLIFYKLRYRCFPVNFAKYSPISKAYLGTGFCPSQRLALPISALVNMTKSTVSCGFGHIY